jgi:hypothetical protein
MQRVSGNYRWWQSGCLAFFGLVFIGGGLAAVVIPIFAANLISFAGGQFQFNLGGEELLPMGITAVCVGLPLGLVGLLMVGGAVRTMLARARMTPPELAMSTSTPRVGEIFTVDYQQTFRAATNMQLLRLSLILRESATYRRGTDTVTVTHDHYVQTYDLPPRQFSGGETLRERRQFQIPPQSMHSFGASRNKLNWFLKVLVQVPGWPDFDDEFSLTVPPEIAR